MAFFQKISHQKITCPFCFEAFPPHEIRFRCIVPNCSGRAPDPVFAQARGQLPLPMGRILVPGGHGRGIPYEIKCDACKTPSHTRVCPNCHFELSQDVGQVDQRIIAIIGGSATGKTHYIASLVHRLQNEIGPNFSFTIRMMGEHTQERWERDFFTPLFINKTVLQPTQSASLDALVKSPLIFRLLLNNGSHSRAINISFFDSAGEDMTSLTTMSVQNRYICYADAIIFLLDPLQIPKVRHLVPKLVNLPASNPKASPEHIVGHLRDLFERQYHLHPTQKVKVPVAFTLSKVDTLFDLLDRGSILRQPGEHFGQLDLDDIQSVSTEIENYLSMWISPMFCNIVAGNFATYHYFGVSSLGQAPNANNQLSSVNPLRVEDPFLWILHKLDLIRARKGR